MDPISRINIMSFINDFNLRKPDGVTSFTALIIFQLNNTDQIIETEVLIITSKKFEAIYFLGPEINSTELPDTFTSENEKFVYITNKCLQISIKHEKNDFVISVFPI